jgi:hypothetical protein
MSHSYLMPDAPAHSLTHSLPRPLPPSLTRPRTHALTHSLTPSPTHTRTRSHVLGAGEATGRRTRGLQGHGWQRQRQLCPWARRCCCAPGNPRYNTWPAIPTRRRVCISVQGSAVHGVMCARCAGTHPSSLASSGNMPPSSAAKLNRSTHAPTGPLHLISAFIGQGECTPFRALTCCRAIGPCIARHQAQVSQTKSATPFGNGDMGLR